MSDDVPDLAALRGDRMASDAEYIEQLEQFSVRQERELRRLRAVVDAVYAVVHPGVYSKAAAVAQAELLVASIRNVTDERDRLRAALRAVMTETGTSTLAHHYARDALDATPTGEAT